MDWAIAHAQIRAFRAHTLPEVNASTRVLEKCGFRHAAEIHDPVDGPVWRWELDLDPAGTGRSAGAH